MLDKIEKFNIEPSFTENEPVRAMKPPTVILTAENCHVRIHSAGIGIYISLAAHHSIKIEYDTE